MEDKPDWSKTKLQQYLLYDYWTPYNAWSVLASFDYNAESDNNFQMGVLGILDQNLQADLVFDDDPKYVERFKVMQETVDFLRNVWHSGDNGSYSRPPYVFIEWALSKRFRPEWLDWAIEQKLYTPKQEAAQPAQIATAPTLPLFDTTANNYPLELATAWQAWQAVSATKGKGKPKARIRSWLDDNTKLSNEAKERISVVCNWDKLGGATRSD